MKKSSMILYWAGRLIAAIILLQTLLFKFSGASESIEIFTRVGMEPWGRIGVGILELVAAVLLLVNATAWMGAALSLGLMAGAILMHLTILGISVQNDGGYLFLLAWIVAICSSFVLLMNKEKILVLMKPFQKN
jgi:putative oxidoreductase